MSVIVVDLGGAIIDEAFGALALEQLVQTAESWGAEAIFADASPLSERVLAELEHPPLLIAEGPRAPRSRSPSRSRARSAGWSSKRPQGARSEPQASEGGPPPG